MESILHIALSNALVAGVVAILATGAARLKARPALIHALWLVALLKLVTPPVMAVRLPVAAPNFGLALPDAGLTGHMPAIGDATAHGDWPAAAMDDVRPAAGPVSAAAPSPARVQQTAGVVRHAWRRVMELPWVAIAMAIWAGGSLLVGTSAVVRTVRFHRLLRLAHAAPPAVVAQMRQAAAMLDLARVPDVRMIDGPVSPMLWCFGARALLLVPALLWQRLSATQQMVLLAHELAHWKRRDHWVRLLELLVAVLYWWHPAVWFGRRALREAEEQCCDAWVVWAMPHAARQYAAALVETLDFVADDGRMPSAASGLTGIRGMMRRLTMIMRATTPRSLSSRGRMLVIAGALLLLPMMPTLGGEQEHGRDVPVQAAEGRRGEGERRDGVESRERVRGQEAERREAGEARTERRDAERGEGEARRARDADAGRNRLIGGEFVKAEDGTVVLAVGDGARQVTVPLTPETHITLDGAPAKVNDIPAGAYVRIALEDGIARRLEARSPRAVRARGEQRDPAERRPAEGERDRRPAEGERERRPAEGERERRGEAGREVPAVQRDQEQAGNARTLIGELISIEDGALMLAVGEGGRQLTVATQPDTEILVAGNRATLADIKPDMLVRVTQEAGLTKRVEAIAGRGRFPAPADAARRDALRGEGERPAGEQRQRPRRGLRGRVVRFDPPSSLVMQIPFEGEWHQVAVTVGEQVEVTSAGSKIAPAELKAGQLVVVHQVEGRAVGIEVIPGER